MTINETISKARGECRHEWDYDSTPYICKHRCGMKHVYINDKSHSSSRHPISGSHKLYDSDLAAWTPELYQWIEDEGLWREFVKHLCELNNWKRTRKAYPIQTLWDIAKATPLQKAQALVRAIEEV